MKSCSLPPSSVGVARYKAFPAPRNPDALRAGIPGELRKHPVYAYIVTSIKATSPGSSLHQRGSAPNFSGGRITLCTCKHKDRATFFKKPHDPNYRWKNVWIAGFTSKTEVHSRGLAYLMCVERSFLSQFELWHALSVDCRQAKSASSSALGDLFKPKKTAADDPYNPANYFRPVAGHVHSCPVNPDAWHHDIMQWGRSLEPHPLLLGQKAQSYRWSNVKMAFKPAVMGVSAHHKRFKSLEMFIKSLEEYIP